MRITVTVKSDPVTRPSEHRLSPAFAGGIDYTESFTCKHSRKHADLFMKILDVSAMQCGLDTREWTSQHSIYFLNETQKLYRQIDYLHKFMKKMKICKTKTSRPGAK